MEINDLDYFKQKIYEIAGVPKSRLGSMENLVNQTKKEIYDLLCKLKEKGKAFNMLNGSLYSGICADEMNNIFNTLKDKHSIDVQFYQPCEGRVVFYNLDELIDEYKCE